MALLRNKTKRENFLIVSKIFLQDKTLTLRERGLLATMHALPDNWDFSYSGMGIILPDSEGVIKKAFQGLVKKGYVTKSQMKCDNGKFGKNIVEINEKPLVKNPISENLPTDDTPADKTLAVEEGQYNINKYNNKQGINNQSINPSDDLDGTDRQSDVNAYNELIANNIRLDLLLDKASYRGPDEIAMVNEIYDLICDMVCYSRASVNIKGTEYPWNAVKSRFLKLNHQHVANILNRIVDDKLKIKNMSSYLISTLYSESLVGTVADQASMADDYLKSLRNNPY